MLRFRMQCPPLPSYKGLGHRKLMSHNNSPLFCLMTHYRQWKQGLSHCITCTKCKKQYIGETGRPFRSRIYEHRYSLSNKKPEDPPRFLDTLVAPNTMLMICASMWLNIVTKLIILVTLAFFEKEEKCSGSGNSGLFTHTASTRWSRSNVVLLTAQYASSFIFLYTLDPALRNRADSVSPLLLTYVKVIPLLYPQAH